ncbi:MAG: hypothetical protein ACXVJY_18975, partial [Ilumatobacteraceae bacterium]
MTVNKRLLFGSLALAAAVVVTVTVIAASRNSSGATDNVDLTPGKSLSPTIGTNAAVTGHAFPRVNLETLNGDTYASGDLVGHPLVVNFW